MPTTKTVLGMVMINVFFRARSMVGSLNRRMYELSVRVRGLARAVHHPLCPMSAPVRSDWTNRPTVGMSQNTATTNMMMSMARFCMKDRARLVFPQVFTCTICWPPPTAAPGGTAGY